MFLKFEAMYTVLLSAFHVIYVKISSHDIIPLSLVKIGAGTAEILMTLSLCGGWVVVVVV